MFHDCELELEVTDNKDFLPLAMGGCSLGLIAAFSGPMSIWLILVNCFLLFFSYYIYMRPGNRDETMVNTLKTNINGDLLLEQLSVPVIFGQLSGSQWCSRYMAVLRYKAAGRIGHLVILKVKQHPDQFRQLSVWLRHNSRNEGRQQQ